MSVEKITGEALAAKHSSGLARESRRWGMPDPVRCTVKVTDPKKKEIVGIDPVHVSCRIERYRYRMVLVLLPLGSESLEYCTTFDKEDHGQILAKVLTHFPII